MYTYKKNLKHTRSSTHEFTRAYRLRTYTHYVQETHTQKSTFYSHENQAHKKYALVNIHEKNPKSFAQDQ